MSVTRYSLMGASLAVATVLSTSMLAQEPVAPQTPAQPRAQQDMTANVSEDGAGLLVEILATGAKLKFVDQGGQTFAVTLLNLRTIPQRLGSSGVAIIGIAGVVIVLVSVLSIAQGFAAAMEQTGSESRALIMRSGADSEMTSGLSNTDVDIIKQAPGLRRDGQNAVATAELYVIIDIPKIGTNTPANVPMRGVEPMATTVRDEFSIVQGKMFQFGTNEVVVGRGAVANFQGLTVGSTMAALWHDLVGSWTERMPDGDPYVRPRLARSVASYRALGWSLEVTALTTMASSRISNGVGTASTRNDACMSKRGSAKRSRRLGVRWIRSSGSPPWAYGMDNPGDAAV